MKRIPIAVVAGVLAAAGFCSPTEALPRNLPSGILTAVPAPLLLPVRYHRHRHYRHHDEPVTPATDADAGAIKPGQWEFAAQLEAAAMPSPGVPASSGRSVFGGGTKSTYAICVAPDKAVPSAFVAGCRLDALHRDGGRITWSMTCTNRQNAVRSDGLAQYRGDTMTATMVSHLPSAKTGGRTIDVAQRITGHYLGPCPSAAAAAAPGVTAGTAATTAARAPAPAPTAGSALAAATPGTTAATSAATAAAPPASATAEGTASAPATPRAATTTATSPASAPTGDATSAAAKPEASPAAPTEASEPSRAEKHVARHQRQGRHRRHYVRRRRHGGYYGGGYYGDGSYSGFGPNPYSANGY
jgi:hypothetical protein